MAAEIIDIKHKRIESGGKKVSRYYKVVRSATSANGKKMVIISKDKYLEIKAKLTGKAAAPPAKKAKAAARPAKKKAAAPAKKTTTKKKAAAPAKKKKEEPTRWF